MTQPPNPLPIAVGAIGGSGTRIVAQFLQHAGYFIGSDLNRAYDNLWFTLLFKRRSVLVEPRNRLEVLAELFFQRLQNSTPLAASAECATTLPVLAAQDRPQHAASWLKDRLDTFCTTTSEPIHPRWGWKEPNSHIVIEPLLEIEPRLRYLHIRRNGLDMAYSMNQNQLALWGDIFLSRSIQITPRDSLAYWCEADRRIQQISMRFPSRVKIMDFDKICQNPIQACQDILAFCGAPYSADTIQALAATIQTPTTSGRFRAYGLDHFDRRDIEYIQALGYDLR